AREYFALALRITGLFIALSGLRYVVDSGLGLLGYFTLLRTSTAYYLIVGLCYLFAGLYLLRGAPHLVGFAYPREAETMLDPIDSDNAQPQVISETEDQ